eukprot:CAMPEP_0174732978 /NCGR_PEP_ID=MMETSP1094-20130205/60413_1 /TAXON_ID=156173 /ORGANISM="Chrysochromulina brevifilum, Strain UTEX LB 985" /LENGTH=48 /DNA_ID= /DNA_START= /DNA_END= /DNA_ORIENTATION=
MNDAERTADEPMAARMPSRQSAKPNAPMPLASATGLLRSHGASKRSAS